MNKRTFVVGILTLVACAATLYFHGVAGTDIIFPQLYYLPVILAAIWWERRSWFLTAFLCAFLLASHVISGIEVSITSDLVRGATFLLVGGVAVELSRARRQAGEALQASYRDQAGILGSTLDAVVVANPDGTIRTVNRAALELLGYAEEEIIGQPVGIIFVEEEFFRGIGLAKLLREGAARDVEMTLRTRSGERIPVVVNGSVIRGDDGQLLAVVGVARDVRETTRLWNEILRAEATLGSLNTAAVAVQRALEPEDVFRAVASELGKFGFHTIIFLLDEDQKNLMIAYTSFSPELIKRAEKLTRLRVSNIRFPLDRMPRYMKKEVLENRVTVFAQAGDRIEGFLPAHPKGLVDKLVEMFRLQKGIAAPLVVQGEVIGALGVDSRRLTENDVPAVTAFANQVSIALENARLYEQARQEIAERVRAEETLRRSVTELQNLQHITQALLEVTELPHIMNDVAEGIVTHLGYDFAIVTRYAEEENAFMGLALYPVTELVDQTLALVGRPDLRGKLRGRRFRYRSGTNPVVDRVLDGEVVISDSLADFFQHWISRPVAEALQKLYGMQFYISMPMQVKGNTMGTILAGVRKGPITADQQQALARVANQVVIAIDNARLYAAAQQELTERKRAEEQIKASLREKELLLKEIHHRVKNNLQVVSSLLDFQSEYIEDKQALDVFKESQNRVRSMALVHEQLYQSEGLARIDFAEYVQDLTAHLFRSYGVNWDVVSLKINVGNVLLGVDTAIPCGLIIGELVSNSLKYAFPGGRACSERSESKGEIRIDLHSDDDKLTLIVSDNGVGFPEDLDFPKTETLGLRLVNMLTRQLKGTIELDRSGGTAFKITFARPKP